MNTKKYDLGLVNGMVYTKKKLHKISIGIKNGIIIHIGDINKEECDKLIDCNAKHILPGIVDSQVHFREPGLTHKEDIEHGTKSALLGGITSIFEMPNTSPATINYDEFLKKISIAEKKSWTNFAFFIGACKENLNKLSELEKIKGCAGIKIFLESDQRSGR